MAGAENLPNPPWVENPRTLLCRPCPRLDRAGTGCDRSVARLVSLPFVKHPHGVPRLLAIWHESFLVTGHPAAVLSRLAFCHLVRAASAPRPSGGAVRIGRSCDAVVLRRFPDLGAVAESDDLVHAGLLRDRRAAGAGGASRDVLGKSRSALAGGGRIPRLSDVFRRP